MLSGEGHEIRAVEEDSLAWECGIEPGMFLVSINGKAVEDIFDYRFLMLDEHVDILIREKNGEETLLSLDRNPDEDFGISFKNPLMDGYRSCRNRCIFCFIDQMPKGMRRTLYFKDDDSRLSFLQGNYVTLTNMSDLDIDRIIRYRMEPINISFQTTNPELRVRMLRNRFAGDIFPAVRKLADAGIAMNGQIVLCKGWNDGAELERSISDLTSYLPALQSVSVVPVGLSRFREGLTELDPFTKEDACAVIDVIEKWQKKVWKDLSDQYFRDHPEESGEVVFDTAELMEGAPRHFIHASDEWYLLAGRELPETGRYDGFIQYENGVGMLRLLCDETEDALRRFRVLADEHGFEHSAKPRRTTAVTGMLAAPTIRMLTEKIARYFLGCETQVLAIRNDFFGEMITVTGLITGTDLIKQLTALQAEGSGLGEEILLPITTLRRDERVFLDDVTVDDLERETGVPVRIVGEDGEDLVRAVLGLPPEKKEERQIYEQTDCSNCWET